MAQAADDTDAEYERIMAAARKRSAPAAPVPAADPAYQGLAAAPEPGVVTPEPGTTAAALARVRQAQQAPAPQTAPALAPQGAAADDTDAQYERLMAAARAAAPPPAAPAAAAPPPSPGPGYGYGAAAPYVPAAVTNLASGLVQGGKDVADTVAHGVSWLDRQVPAVNWLDRQYAGGSQGIANALDAQRQAYEAGPAGQSWFGAGGRLAGQMVATAPLTGGMGGVAGAGVRAAADVLPELGTAANFLGRTAGRAVQGGAVGGTYGAATSGANDQTLAQNVLQGAAGGAVAGPVVGAVGDAAGAALGSITPEVAKLAQLARDKYGIPITAPQMSGSSFVRIANEQSANLPFSGAGPAMAKQQTAWQRAVSRVMGEDAPLVTPEVMTQAAKRIGGVFNDVANRTNVQGDNQLIDALGAIEDTAGNAPLGPGGHAAVKQQIDNILGALAKGNGSISGDAYQQLNRAGAPLQLATKAADPNVRNLAGQIKEALDGAFQRSAAPEDQAALTQARSQWRAMKTIEDLVEKSPDGNLSPRLLMGQVRNASNRFDGSTGGMAYEDGGGPLGDLARIGQRFLAGQPNSGTADRMAVNSAVKNLLGAASAGASAGAAYANPLSLWAIPAGVVVNRAVGAGLRSPWAANRLIGGALANGPRNPVLPNALAATLGAAAYRNPAQP